MTENDHAEMEVVVLCGELGECARKEKDDGGSGDDGLRVVHKFKDTQTLLLPETPPRPNKK